MEATPAISIDNSLIFSVYCHCTVLYSVLIVQLISSWARWNEERVIAVSVSHSQFTLIKCVNWYLLAISSHLRNKKVFFKPTSFCFQGRSWSIESRLYNSLYLVTSWPSWVLVPRFLFSITKSKVQNGQHLPTLLQIRCTLMLFGQIRCCTQGSNEKWQLHCSDQARLNDSEKKRGRFKGQTANNSLFCPKYIED